MCGVFAKSGVRVHSPHHVSHFLSIFDSVHDYLALPLSAGSMMMELSFFSVCRATLFPLLMLDFGSLACLMVRTTSLLSSSAADSVIYFATTSVPAMIYSTGRVVGVLAKFKPLLSIDHVLKSEATPVREQGP